MLPRIVCRTRLRLKQAQGAVALEAMLSIVLLFVAFYCMWGAALVVYNQSRLNTAAQLSAQSALVIFDRSTYRGINPKNVYTSALDRSTRIAWSVYRENSCGMLPNQFTGETPDSACDAPLGSPPPNFDLSIQCSAFINAGYTTNNCFGGGIGNAQALRVRVSGQVVSPFDLLSPFSGFGANHDEQVAMLSTTADSYSFAAEGKVR